MKNPETIGRVLAAKKRGRSTRFGVVENIRNGWRRFVDRLTARPKWIGRALLVILLLGVGFDFVSFSFQSLPAIPEAIRISGIKQVSADMVRTEISRKLRAANADNLIEVDLADMSDHLLRRIPAIRSATITMNVGKGDMTVAVVERYGFAQLRLPQMGGMLEVDREGMLYPAAGSARPASPMAVGSRGTLPEIVGIAGPMVVPGRNLHEHPSGAGLMRILVSMPAKFPRALKSIRVVRPDHFELGFAGNVVVKADPANFPHKIDHLKTIFAKIAAPAGSAAPRPQVPASPTPAGSAAPRPQVPASRISAFGASSVGVSDADPTPAGSNKVVSYIDIRFQRDVIAYTEEESSSSKRGPKKGR